MRGYSVLRVATLSAALLLASLAAGCATIPALRAPTSTPTPPPTDTPTPTPTSTVTPTPTATCTPTPSPTPTTAPLALSVQLEPTTVPQGEIATLLIQANRPATVTATLLGRPLPLFQEAGRWYALIGIWAGTQPATWPIVVKAIDPLAGTSVVERRDLRIAGRQFEIENVELSDSTMDLILDTETVNKEAQLIARLITPRTPERLWQGAFQQPIAGEVTSTYGQRRSYNGGPASEYHGGLDLAADEGQPVAAANAGQVVFAGPLQVRGNVVIIDHGWGLYSGYYHMSALKTTVGQHVERGETIGLVGSTGFSTGPHVHWVVWLGGNAIDPAFLLGWRLPD